MGTAKITVSATDDSGQNNTEAIPVTFKVTVNEPPPPLLSIDKGLCITGMTLQPGESCTYFADQGPITFYVNKDNEGCRTSEHPITIDILGLPFTVNFLCADEDITGDEVDIRGNNPFDPNFHAIKNPDGSWTIKNVP